MRRTLSLCVGLMLLVGCCSNGDESGTSEGGLTKSELRGPYLGQEAPGSEPRLFAPGIVSTALTTRDATMMPDGSEFYFSVVVGPRPMIMMVRRTGAVWQQPVVAAFSGVHYDIEPWIAPNGSRLYFMSNRPSDGGAPIDAWQNQDLWFVERTGETWGEPRPVGPPVNSNRPEYFPSVTQGGVLYFTREDEQGVSWIFRAAPGADGFLQPERLGPEVNCGSNRFNAAVAPDESFVIVPAMGREDGLGGVDYYVVFRSDDDRWSEPILLGEPVSQAQGREWSASFSPDGQYLFFMSSRSPGGVPADLSGMKIDGLQELASQPGRGGSAIWWIDMEVVRKLRPVGF